jgi:hypothetical protein
MILQVLLKRRLNEIHQELSGQSFLKLQKPNLLSFNRRGIKSKDDDHPVRGL